MEPLGSKILAMVLLAGISIILSLIPLKLGKWFKTENGQPKHVTIFSCLLCFGGGVLIATSLLHMLPEVRENFEVLLENTKLNIPLGEIVLMVGFFLIYFVEEFVNAMCGAHSHGHSHGRWLHLNIRFNYGNQLSRHSLPSLWGCLL